MNITVVGAGYVGLVTSLCFANCGHVVRCVDIDPDKIARLAAGHLPLHEAGLDDLLQRHLATRFFPMTDLRAAIAASELTMITVGTPLENGAINLRFVTEAAAAIGAVLSEKLEYHAVVVKSTVIPGTTDGVVRKILEETSGKKSGSDFGVGMNPEFLREGEAVADFLTPDRIVLGGNDQRCLDVMDRLYFDFPDAPRIYTDTRTAEMIKYASNALLATLISFSNEIGNLCTIAPDVDVVEVMRGVHLDRRITSIAADGSRVTPAITTYLKAGCGFGGSCFPKDIRALIRWSDENARPSPLLKAVVETNTNQPGEVLRLLKKHFAVLRGVRVAVLGLAFKSGTDDIRESPALRVISDLRADGADVTAYDPIAGPSTQPFLDNLGVDYRPSLAEAIRDAEAVILMTAWPEFQFLPDLIERSGLSPVVIDGRRVLDRQKIARYEGIGLSPGLRSHKAGAELVKKIAAGH